MESHWSSRDRSSHVTPLPNPKSTKQQTPTAVVPLAFIANKKKKDERRAFGTIYNEIGSIYNELRARAAGRHSAFLAIPLGGSAVEFLRSFRDIPSQGNTIIESYRKRNAGLPLSDLLKKNIQELEAALTHFQDMDEPDRFCFRCQSFYHGGDEKCLSEDSDDKTYIDALQTYELSYQSCGCDLFRFAEVQGAGSLRSQWNLPSS